MKGSSILTADFSSEIIEDRRQWDDIFKVMREKLSTKTLVSSKYSPQNSRRSYNIHNKQN
jgi:hypothetical protein